MEWPLERSMEDLLMGAKVKTKSLRKIRVDEAAEIWKAWEH